MPAQQLRAVPREQVVGQVKASLRPFRLDPLEVRQSLLVALSLGYDPREMYLAAIRNRPRDYEPAPPLPRVLPQSILDYLEEKDNREYEEFLPPA